MNLTAIIISFLRPEYTKECVRSLREQYPDIQIFVGDNEKYNEDIAEVVKKNGGRYFVLPYDSGVTGGRNKLVELVETDYILVGDDDFYYADTANVDKMLQFVQFHDDISLIGGLVKENGEIRQYQGTIDIHPDHLHFHKADPALNTKDKTGLTWQSVDICFNYFVARKADLISWDENIKVAYEHSDWFLMLKKKGVKCAYTPDAVVIHKPEHVKIDNTKYKQYRNRKEDKLYWFQKYGIEYSIGFNGVKSLKKGKYQVIRPEPPQYIVGITHFERKDSLTRLIKSIAKHRKDVKIVIADSSKEFDVTYYKNLWSECQFDTKPIAYRQTYDCGLSAMRNYIATMCKSHYILYLEDDFEWTEETNPEAMLKLMDHETGIVGGAVKEDKTIDFHGALKRKGKVLELYKDEHVDFVLNFIMVRKRSLADCSWDDEQKIFEHTDFFWRFKKTKWKVKYTEDSAIAHHRDRPVGYNEYRDRKEYLTRFFRKHNLKYLIQFGKVMELNEKTNKIKTYARSNKRILNDI